MDNETVEITEGVIAAGHMIEDTVVAADTVTEAPTEAATGDADSDTIESGAEVEADPELSKEEFIRNSRAQIDSGKEGFETLVKEIQQLTQQRDDAEAAGDTKLASDLTLKIKMSANYLPPASIFIRDLRFSTELLKKHILTKEPLMTVVNAYIKGFPKGAEPALASPYKEIYKYIKSGQDADLKKLIGSLTLTLSQVCSAGKGQGSMRRDHKLIKQIILSVAMEMSGNVSQLVRILNPDAPLFTSDKDLAMMARFELGIFIGACIVILNVRDKRKAVLRNADGHAITSELDMYSVCHYAADKFITLLTSITETPERIQFVSMIGQNLIQQSINIKYDFPVRTAEETTAMIDAYVAEQKAKQAASDEAIIANADTPLTAGIPAEAPVEAIHE